MYTYTSLFLVADFSGISDGRLEVEIRIVSTELYIFNICIQTYSKYDCQLFINNRHI